jgi:predicted transcriptional regulator
VVRLSTITLVRPQIIVSNDCSLEEIQYRLYVRQMIEEGRQDVRRGDVVSQQEVEQDLERWLAT